MLLNQELYNQINNYIDENYIVFDKKSYSFVLENRLNDSNFINEYIFSDCQANAAELLALLQELTEVFAVNLEVGVSIAEEYQRLYENQNVIKNSIEKIGKIKTKIEEENLELSSGNVSQIRQVLDVEESNLLSIDAVSLNENNKKGLNDALAELKAVRFELDNIFKNFFEDIDFEAQITRAFKINSVWTTNYGGYNYNPYLSIPNIDEQASVDFDILTNCEYLKNTNKGYFSPLVHADKLFISVDGVSITVIDSNNNEKRIELNDEIIFSGTIMYLKMDRFLIVPCKKAIQIIDIIHGPKLFTSINYSGFGEDYEVKSVASFNNYCYINISDYTNNNTIIWRLMYYNRFIPRRKVLQKRILSNLSLVYDSKSAKMKLYCIDDGGDLINLDCNSLDELDHKSLKALPIDNYYKSGNNIVRYNYPIMSYDDKIYYLSFLKDLSLSLCIVDPSSENLETTIKLPKYQKQNKDAELVPSFSNIVLNDEKAAILGPFDKRLATFKYVYKDVKLKEDVDSTEARPYAKNTFILMNDDNPVRITDKFNLDNKSFAKIVCVWGKRIVVLVDNPQGNNYTLYVEIKR